MKTRPVDILKTLAYSGLLVLMIACHKPRPEPVPPVMPPLPAPEISFTATVDVNSSPVRVEFSNTSTNASNVNWAWNFGDDSTSIEKSPVHYYYDQGTYTVKLTGSLNGTTLPVVTKTVTIPKDLLLRAWYKFDGTEKKADFSGYNNTLTALSGISNTDITGHKGITNTAVEFNNANSFMLMPNSLISVQTADVNSIARTTISMWVYFNDLSGHNGLTSIYSGDVTAYVPILFTSGRQLRGMFWDNPEADFIPLSSGSSNLLTVNKWHHLAIAGDPSGQSLYLDGQKVASRNKPITHLSMNTNYLGWIPIRPGARWFLPEESNIPRDTAYSLNARLDDVRIYNKRLSDSEILALSKE